jgi:PKHD-type hydroxylase
MKFEWYFYKNFYSTKQCRELSAVLENCPPDGVDIPAIDVTKTAKVHTVKWGIVKHFFKDLESVAHYTNKEMFGYSLYNFQDQDMINYNTYSSNTNGEYGWHKDVELDKIYDLKLTVIANLSTEKYEGGQFELFMNGPVHIKELDDPGSVLIFPSYYVHRVLPVTQGNRKTVSFWIPGPNFR